MGDDFLTIQGARENNLKDVDLDIPPGCSSASPGLRLREGLEIRYRDKSIAEVLEMTVAWDHGRAGSRLPAPGAGLHDPVRRGGATGQALVRALQDQAGRPHLYVLDEPTTGLHLADIRKLLVCLDRLVDQGHTVLVIEHHLDVIKSADYVIDMGPEGGNDGGYVVAQGTPEQVAEIEASATGRYLGQFLGSASPRLAAAPHQ